MLDALSPRERFEERQKGLLGQILCGIRVEPNRDHVPVDCGAMLLVRMAHELLTPFSREVQMQRRLQRRLPCQVRA